MTRNEDDKMGNNEFGDYDDADYNRKVEARWTKEAKTGKAFNKINDSHARDEKKK